MLRIELYPRFDLYPFPLASANYSRWLMNFAIYGPIQLKTLFFRVADHEFFVTTNQGTNIQDGWWILPSDSTPNLYLGNFGVADHKFVSTKFSRWRLQDAWWILPFMVRLVVRFDSKSVSRKFRGCRSRIFYHIPNLTTLHSTSLRASSFSMSPPAPVASLLASLRRTVNFFYNYYNKESSRESPSESPDMIIHFIKFEIKLAVLKLWQCTSITRDVGLFIRCLVH